MKTPGQIHEQRVRLFHKMVDLTTARAKRRHPATGGNHQLVHNWGNDEAKAIWHHSQRAWASISEAFDRAAAAAEHRNHSEEFKPLWCKHCMGPQT